MDGWNTSFLLGWPIFRGYVCFRERKNPSWWLVKRLNVKWIYTSLFLISMVPNWRDSRRRSITNAWGRRIAHIQRKERLGGWTKTGKWKLDTVDGRNPTPVDMVIYSTGFYTSQVVQDLFYQQYLYSRSCSVVILLTVWVQRFNLGPILIYLDGWS